MITAAAAQKFRDRGEIVPFLLEAMRKDRSEIAISAVWFIIKGEPPQSVFVKPAIRPLINKKLPIEFPVVVQLERKLLSFLGVETVEINLTDRSDLPERDDWRGRKP